MLKDYHQQRNEALIADRSRKVIFYSGNQKLEASAGDLVDASSSTTDWVYIYEQPTREQVENGGANSFDLAAVCKKFSSVSGKLKDDDIEFHCKKGQIEGRIRRQPKENKNLIEITEITAGKVSGIRSSNNGKIFLTRKYLSPTWFVEKRFDAKGKLQSRNESRNGKPHGLYFNKRGGLRTEYRDGKVIRSFKP